MSRAYNSQSLYSCKSMLSPVSDSSATHGHNIPSHGVICFRCVIACFLLVDFCLYVANILN